MGVVEDLEATLAAQLATVTTSEVIVPPIESQPEALREPTVVQADPRFLALVYGRFRPDIVRTHALPLWVTALPYHLDPVDWRTGFLEVHEGGAPMDVREGLQESVPQAQLRDLFRPEYSNEPVLLEPLELPLDPGGRRAFAELHATLERAPVPVIEQSVRALEAIADERRRFLSTPWKPHLDDDTPRREVYVVIEPSLNA